MKSRLSPGSLRCLVAIALLAVATQPTAVLAQDAIRSFLVEQEVPVLEHVKLDADGSSHGDLLAFEAPITGEDGASGTLWGVLITVDLADESGNLLEDRVGQLVFQLGEDDSIVVAGTSVYAHATTEMNPNEPQLRPIIGGTGAFIGARGQVTTTRHEDGTYDHLFELLE